jgi:hypothetical protein
MAARSPSACFRVLRVFCGSVIASALIAAPAVAAPKNAKPAKPVAKTVELFEAMKSDQIGVKFIPKNANSANLIIENKTKEPLQVQVPEAFAGVPVILNQAAAADAGQGLGGGQGGPAFNIAAEKTRRIEVPCLCLEHGKRDPTPKMAYEIKPIEALTTKSETVALIKRYARGDVNVKAAQAAAWHLENGMSWQQLASKKITHLLGPDQPYFNERELTVAVNLVRDATAKAKEAATFSPVESGSDSLSPAKSE